MITEPFTAAFITEASGILEYRTYAASPEEMLDELADTSSLNVPVLDARLAADGYIRTGGWSRGASFDVTWTGIVHGCLVRHVAIPAGVAIRHAGRPLTVTEAITVTAGSSGHVIEVTTVDAAGQPRTEAVVLPASLPPARPARTQVSPDDPHSPAVARTRIACYTLAADLAEAANLLAAVMPGWGARQ